MQSSVSLYLYCRVHCYWLSFHFHFYLMQILKREMNGYRRSLKIYKPKRTQWTMILTQNRILLWEWNECLQLIASKYNSYMFWMLSLIAVCISLIVVDQIFGVAEQQILKEGLTFWGLKMLWYSVYAYSQHSTVAGERSYRDAISHRSNHIDIAWPEGMNWRIGNTNTNAMKDEIMHCKKESKDHYCRSGVKPMGSTGACVSPAQKIFYLLRSRFTWRASMQNQIYPFCHIFRTSRANCDA